MTPKPLRMKPHRRYYLLTNKMWILPNTPQFSQYALASVDSKEELKTLSLAFEQYCTWRGKHGSHETWSRRWKRAEWLRVLYSQTLRLSIQPHFGESYAASLADTPVRAKVEPDSECVNSMRDSFGRILSGVSAQLTLFSASSKTSKTTSEDLSPEFWQAYEIWVTQLRRESTARLRLGLHIYGRESSSWQLPTQNGPGNAWSTPTVAELNFNRSPGSDKKRLSLSKAIQMWPTPQVGTATYQRDGKGNKGKKRLMLAKAVQIVARTQLWPTPVASEAEKASMNINQNSLSRLSARGHLHPESPNTNGRSLEQLNPAWVAQLMGMSIAEICFEPSAMQWSLRSQD